MSVLKRTVALALALGMVAMFFSACERNITRVEEVRSPMNCFDCHSDQNLALVAAEAQWQNSVHASGLNIDRAGSSRCAGCHSADGFIQRAEGETVTGWDNPSPIHCFACHAPHSEGDFGLRWTSVATLVDGTTYDLRAGNLCAACHQARTAPSSIDEDPFEIPGHFGPHHGNQADMLIGTGGYEFDGFTYAISTHRDATEDACLDCHFKATSNSVVGGHAFNMKYDLRNIEGDVEEVLNTGACEPCHGEIDDFNIGFTFPVQDSVETLIGELEALLETAGLWADGEPVEEAVTSADSAGAVWNLVFVEEDRSYGVHNAKYTLGLLQSAIQFMEGSLAASPGTVAVERRVDDKAMRR